MTLKDFAIVSILMRRKNASDEYMKLIRYSFDQGLTIFLGSNAVTHENKITPTFVLLGALSPHPLLLRASFCTVVPPQSQLPAESTFETFYANSQSQPFIDTTNTMLA